MMWKLLMNARLFHVSFCHLIVTAECYRTNLMIRNEFWGTSSMIARRCCIAFWMNFRLKS
ncbi:hypothetical protein T4B_522 [Trichinella pseudospiralis]|uniref:Uncharacterized protein n=1 Tax=Trichinella pseudospiralis TaxID=6337 RepID=A0A0V1JMX8_TRIPS|nr:hypothetical protein T4A_5876 [Trichinella pseudospiralis]KRZ26112.1 hypothetical protein T4B_522 [Trichinella pseudospiralis]KRZ36334.1 hypothetical protein T4C_7993 [Trichinella pseudospiralis]